MAKFEKYSLIAILVYMLLTFTIPIRRVLFIWQEENATLYGFLFQYGQYILMGLMTLLTAELVFHPDRPLSRLINWITQPKISLSIILPVLVLCVVLTFTGTPGLWWTWFTVGLHIGSIGLFIIILKDRVPAGVAFMTGTAFVFLVVGVWEIIYQCGRTYFYDLPQGIGTLLLAGQIRFMLPFILFGLVMLYLVHKKNRNLFQANYLTVTFTILTAGMLAWWFATGLWSDIYYVYKLDKWFYMEPNPLMMEVYRSSKVFIILIMFSLVYRPKRIAGIFQHSLKFNSEHN